MRMLILRIAIVTSALVVAVYGRIDAQGAPTIFGGRSLVHAHNAYPEDGKWTDRITRGLAIPQNPVVIEQDIALASGGGRGPRSVVSHDAKPTGSEPTLAEHFFDRVRTLMERALAEGQRDRWPLVVLHLDFKTNEREHHRAVWDLLERHKTWLTTASAADARTISPFTRGPLLVLTENGAGQEQDFGEWSKEGGSFLLFGSIPAPTLKASDDPKERARILRQAATQELIPAAISGYRRWVNLSWAAIEEGGPAQAGEWTAEDRQRLESVVNYAHRQRLFVRFYTLNGHTAEASQGWTASYNFGSLDAVRQRWTASIQAHVDLIATDQYRRTCGRDRPRPLTTREQERQTEQPDRDRPRTGPIFRRRPNENRIRLRGAQKRSNGAGARCGIGPLLGRPAIALGRRVGRRVQDRREEPLEDQILSPLFGQLGQIPATDMPQAFVQILIFLRQPPQRESAARFATAPRDAPVFR